MINEFILSKWKFRKKPQSLIAYLFLFLIVQMVILQAACAMMEIETFTDRGERGVSRQKINSQIISPIDTQRAEVLVWLPSANHNRPFGHTALRTYKHYISFPNNHKNIEANQITEEDSLNYCPAEGNFCPIPPLFPSNFPPDSPWDGLEVDRFIEIHGSNEAYQLPEAGEVEFPASCPRDNVDAIERRQRFYKAADQRIKYRLDYINDRYLEQDNDLCIEPQIAAEEWFDKHVIDFCPLDQNTCPRIRSSMLHVDLRPEDFLIVVGETINADPDIHVKLYDLNVEAINKEYERLKPNLVMDLYSGSPYFEQQNTFYCSSLVLHLLHKGGIDNLLTSAASKGRWYGGFVGAITGSLGTLISLGYNNNKPLAVALPPTLTILGMWLGGVSGGVYEAYQDSTKTLQAYSKIRNSIGINGEDQALHFLRAPTPEQMTVLTQFNNSILELFIRNKFLPLWYGNGDNLVKKLIAAPIHVAELAKIAERNEASHYTQTSSTSRVEIPFYLLWGTSILNNIQYNLQSLIKTHVSYIFSRDHSPTLETNVLILAPNKVGEAPGKDILNETWMCEISLTNKLLCKNADQTLTRAVSKFTAKPWNEVLKDHYGQCDLFTKDGLNLRHCVGERTEFIEYNQIVSMVEPSVLSAFSVAAAYGAVNAVLPEVFGDILHLSGVLSQKNAQHIKTAANLAFLFVTGSWITTSTSFLTSAGLKCIGCSELKARIGGNIAALFVNMGRNVTPIGIGTTMVSYGAGKFGLWVEKQAIQKLFSSPKKPIPAQMQEEDRGPLNVIKLILTFLLTSPYILLVYFLF